MWNPDQYLKFAAERKQPFEDLLSLVQPRQRMIVADLGCGTGAWTRELHEKLQATQTTGIDSSPAMLAKASELATETLTFRQQRIEDIAEKRAYDLVFSNAALHWVAGHESLFERLTSALRRGGQLAIQMPANDDHPSHFVAAAIATSMRIDVRQSPVLLPERYAAILHSLGASRQTQRLHVYSHLLESPAAVVEWVRGTLLVDYERQLTPAAFATFLDSYRHRLLAVLGDVRPYLYTYKRILIAASWD